MIEIPQQFMVLRRVLRWGGALVTGLLLVSAIGLLLAVIPVFGNKALIVRSGSMTPAIGVGDLVIVRGTNSYAEGDIIAFRSANSEDVVVTHRIAEVADEGFVTKGDANEAADESLVTADRVLGRQIVTVPYVGRALGFGKTRVGFVSFIVVPALLIIAGDIHVIVRELRKRRRQTTPSRPWRATPERERPVALPPAPIMRRVSARVYVDSLVRPLMLLVIALSLTVPSALAVYTDSEISEGNIFAAASSFETDPFADIVVSVVGTFGHCCNVGDLSSDPAVAEPLVTGAPDSPPAQDFIQISDNGEVVVKFVDNKALLSGDSSEDIIIHTYDTLFPGEAEIFVSQDCTSFESVGSYFDTPADLTVEIDVDALVSPPAFVKCVKLVDLVDSNEDFPTLGFDLDAVEAVSSMID